MSNVDILKNSSLGSMEFEELFKTRQENNFILSHDSPIFSADLCIPSDVTLKQAGDLLSVFGEGFEVSGVAEASGKRSIFLSSENTVARLFCYFSAVIGGRIPSCYEKASDMPSVDFRGTPVYLHGGFYVEYLTVDKKFHTDYMESVMKMFPYKDSEKGGSVYSFLSANGDLILESVGIGGSPFIENNYSEKVVEGYNYIKKSLRSDDPPGRLVIINGPTGTGKTYLLRGLIGSVEDAMFCLLPLSLLASLDGPSMLRLLVDKKAGHYDMGAVKVKKIVLIVEDGDAALLTREVSESQSLVSILLNVADGLLGGALDLRVIVTSNIDSMDLDEAIVRPGRLMSHLHVGALDSDQASGVYKSLTGEDRLYSSPTPLSQVYADSIVEDRGCIMFGDAIENKDIGF